MLSKSRHTRSNTSPFSIVSIPRTFSPTTQRGRSSDITRNICGQRWRPSPVPFLFPAWEKGWQGKPPVRRSISPRPVFSRLSCSGDCRDSPPWALAIVSYVNSLMSDIIGVFGQCLRSTCWQNGSISQNATTLCSGQHQEAARAKPPMPEKRSRCFTPATPPDTPPRCRAVVSSTPPGPRRFAPSPGSPRRLWIGQASGLPWRSGRAWRP